jgi:hypothetical protein
MFEVKSKTINNIPFKVVPFPAAKAYRLKLRLLKLIGPAFGRLVGSFDGANTTSFLNAKVDGEQLAEALESLFTQLTEDEFMALLKDILQGVSCEITGADERSVLVNMADEFETKLDMVFQGRLFTVYPVILFVLEVNYPDFFGQMAGIGNRLATIMSKLGGANVVN